eukprot:7268432-Prymnesium_polylepis.1
MEKHAAKRALSLASIYGTHGKVRGAGRRALGRSALRTSSTNASFWYWPKCVRTAAPRIRKRLMGTRVGSVHSWTQPVKKREGSARKRPR